MSTTPPKAPPHGDLEKPAVVTRGIRQQRREPLACQGLKQSKHLRPQIQATMPQKVAHPVISADGRPQLAAAAMQFCRVIGTDDFPRNCTRRNNRAATCSPIIRR